MQTYSYSTYTQLSHHHLARVPVLPNASTARSATPALQRMHALDIHTSCTPCHFIRMLAATSMHPRGVRAFSGVGGSRAMAPPAGRAPQSARSRAAGGVCVRASITLYTNPGSRGKIPEWYVLGSVGTLPASPAKP